MGNRFDEVKTESERVPYNVVKGDNNTPRVSIDDRKYSPQEISAMILQKMKKTAEDFIGQEVTQAVVTVPAYFNDAQRQATKEAGEIAGLKVERIINEPTAAALAYGMDKSGKDMKIVVFDFGGGTHDVSILELGDGVFEVLSTDGDTHLGGDDVDQKIIDWLADEFKKDEGVDLKKASTDDIDKALERLNRLNSSTEGEQVAVLKERMQQNMQNNFGVFRREDLMVKGIGMLNDSRGAVENIYLQDKSAAFNTARIEALEMQNLFEVAEATAITANERKESRGAHARDDYPERNDDDWLKHSIYFSKTKEVSKRDVNYRPKTVQAFQPAVRTY